MSGYSLSWDDGAIVAIDQRGVPHRVAHLRITTVDELVSAIVSLAIRGAPALGVAGALGVALSALANPASAVRRDAERISAARPTAANLAWGVRRALARLPEGPQAVLDEALAMVADDVRANRAAATNAAEGLIRLCPDRALRVLTHCNTGRLATVAHGTALVPSGSWPAGDWCRKFWSTRPGRCCKVPG